MEAFRCLGFLDSDQRKPVRVSSYPEFLEQMLGLPVGRFNDSGGTGGLLGVVARRIHANPTDPIVGRVMAALGEFGMLGAALSSNAVHEAINAPAPLDAFCTILQRSLALTNRDRDMVCMVHEFGTLTPKGTHEIYRSSLIEYGQPNGGATAMSRTVGVPAAIAAHMLLTHKIKTKGVIRPTLKEIYDPLLDTLSTLGITFSEQRLASHAAAIKSSI
ncbi:hypothetical protein EV182_002072 [Spiromyces aspiralis]|uniref:Uncharacterized protein n=1 Tax=Spiromyces aspiralis TaxID=68401 RepID=A0ACC1HG87_9FUNG|nr:hypothetical protein EV182_002072 [Spiromyces aspiralis]